VLPAATPCFRKTNNKRKEKKQNLGGTAVSISEDIGALTLSIIRLAMLRIIDTILVVLFWVALVVLSVISLARIYRGTANGYGQLSVVPKSWLRWIHDEKDPADADRKHTQSTQT